MKGNETVSRMEIVAADIRVGEENVEMGRTAMSVGLNSIGPVFPVAQGVGSKKALEIISYGNLVKGSLLKGFGLINRLVVTEKLDDEPFSWTQYFAKQVF